MTCEACNEAREIDGDIPDCETEKGCKIPPLSERGARVLAVREKLVKLKDLVDPGTILFMYAVSVDDLNLLAEIETILSDKRKSVKAGRENA